MQDKRRVVAGHDDNAPLTRGLLAWEELMRGIPDALAAAVRDRPPRASSDRLAKIREKTREARDIQKQIADTEERVAALKQRLYAVQGGGDKRGELVDLMEGAGVRDFTLEAEGNWPAYAVKLQPFYSASLPRDEEARARALTYIAKDMGVPDIIKKTYVVGFAKGEAKLAKTLEAALKKAKLFDRASVAVTVHPQTLTAEVRRRFESGDPLSTGALETIGATVGKVVRMKPVD